MQTIVLEAAVAEDRDGNIVDAMPTHWLDVAENFIQESRVVALPPAAGMPPLVFTFCYN